MWIKDENGNYFMQGHQNELVECMPNGDVANVWIKDDNGDWILDSRNSDD